MPFIDYYKILGVSPHATQEEIKGAYRRLSKQYHPDLHENNAYYTEKFIEINTAYEALSDEGLRSVYHRYHDAYYNPRQHPQPYAQQYQPKRQTDYVPPQKIKFDARTVIIILIPLILFIAAIVSSENSITEDSRKKREHIPDFRLMQNIEKKDDGALSMEEFSDATFKITLHQYSNYDTAYNTFIQLTNYRYKVAFVNFGNGIYHIDMPFLRPLSDTALVKDSLEHLFATKCAVSL